MRATIIVRAYNAANTIARAVRSALFQRFPSSEYEILIVNDGSTDDISAAIEPFLNDNRVRLINQENKGIIGAANVGFESARGESVVLLDADDEALPDMLSNVTEPIISNAEVDYTFPDYFEEYKGSTNLVRITDVFSAIAGGMGWRRNKLLAEGGFDAGTIFPEYDILLRTWGRWRGFHVPAPALVYHRRDASLASNRMRVEESLVALLKKYPERSTEIASIRSYALS